jgi:hypothetical protein
MKKVIKLKESDIANLVKRVMSEQDYSTDVERGTEPREKDIKSVFGKKYGAYIPNDVIRYMRKNPRQIFKKLYDIYGEKSFEYLNDAKSGDELMESHDHGNSRYMFFSNLEQMNRQTELLMDLDQSQVESILENGHDWAQDHIAEAKNNMDQVFDFIMNEINHSNMNMSHEEDMVMMEGRKKAGTKLCSRGKSAAKAKFKIYPSAYANGYAVQVCQGKKPGLDGKKKCSSPYC